jgi:hypothetical protein
LCFGLSRTRSSSDRRVRVHTAFDSLRRCPFVCVFSFFDTLFALGSACVLAGIDWKGGGFITRGNHWLVWIRTGTWVTGGKENCAGKRQGQKRWSVTGIMKKTKRC